MDNFFYRYVHSLNLILKKKYISFREDDDEENESVKNTPSVMSFFAKNDDSNLERHKFFKERCLISVDKL